MRFFIKKLGKRFFQFLLMAAIMLIIAVPFAWLHLRYPRYFDSLEHIFAHYSSIFTLFRWSLIGLFILSWPILVKNCAKKKQWQVEKQQFWLLQRFRVAGWLIIIELLLCEHWLLILIKAL